MMTSVVENNRVPVTESSDNVDAPNRLMLQLNVTTDQYSSMILDTGSSTSLLRLSSLKNGVFINCEEIVLLNGINRGESVRTLGKVSVKISLNENVTIEHDFSIVPNDFPIESGMLGRDFLNKFDVDISYGNSKIRIFYSDTEYVLVPMSKSENSTFIAARTEMYIRVSCPYKKEMVSIAEELEPNVFTGNCIVDPKNQAAYISVINANDTGVILEKAPKFVPLDEFNVLMTEATSNKAQIKGTERFEKIKNLVEKNLNPDLNIEERNDILSIIEEYADIFHLEGEVLTCTNGYKHVITTYSDVAPVFIKPYRIPQSQRKIVDEEIDRLLKEGVIRHSVSPWNFPILLVPKKKTSPDAVQKHRLCVDFRKLNENTISDRFPLGNINDILDQLGCSKYFTTLDLASSFQQVALDEESMPKTGFSNGYGHYEYCRMTFGLKNGPASLQRFLNHILTGLNGLKCLLYLDDIIVYSTNLTQHHERLTEVFKVLRKENLKLQPTKCHFLQREIIYLGHIVSQHGVSANPEKISAILKIQSPRSAKEIKSYLSMVSYYRAFIPNLSDITEPLTRLLRKNIPFVWSDRCEEAFQLLKTKLTTAPVLAYPDFSKDFILNCDASKYAIGAVISQMHDGKERAIAYASRLLTPAERNYPVGDLEMLAIVYGCENFRCYLYGRQFILYTDHLPLVGNSKNPPLRILKWKLKLAEYSYEIRHISGKMNIISDFLSRIKTDDVLMMTRSKTKIAAMDAAVDGVTEEQNIGNKKQEVENLKKNQRPMTQDEIDEVLQTKPNKRKINNRAKYAGNIKIIMDEKEKLAILKQGHSSLIGGHNGVYRTWKFLRNDFYWPYMLKDVRKYIKKCKECQVNKHFTNTKVPMAITSTSEHVFDKTFCDVVGPLTPSEDGNKYILTFQDDLSKFVLAAPLKDQETATVARAMFDRFISVLGIPKVILTDQGSNFCSKMFAELCKLLKISKIQTSAFHPQSNNVEAFHRPLGEYLRHFTQKNPGSWDKYLSSAVFCYNTHEHRSLKRSPFEMLFGRKPNIPSCYSRPVEPLYNADDYVLDLKHRLQKMHLEARKHLVEAKLNSKKYYDRNAKPFLVKKGDLVLLKDEARVGKLSPLRKGPYEVLEIVSPENSLIKIKNKGKVVHNNRLSLFVADRNDDSDHDSDQAEED